MSDYYEDDFEDDDDPQPAQNGCTTSPQDSTGFERTLPANSPWAVVMDDELDMGDRIAAGAMGAIYAGFYRGRPVAIKTLHDTSHNALSSVETELLVHASLKDSRVVNLVAANLHPPRCCIVMERCECSLFERLHRRPDEISRRTSLNIAIQVAEGMQYLHTRRPAIVHRDLKSHNVLLDAKGDAKLCDFGLVNTREVTAGTPNYMAPELFLSKPFSTSVDVFAFGVLLNEIWAREVPWDGYQPLDIKEKVTAGGRPSTPRTMPYACESLVKKLWHSSASLRPTFAEALPMLHDVLATLPVDRALNKTIELDALDSLAGLTLQPR